LDIDKEVGAELLPQLKLCWGYLFVGWLDFWLVYEKMKEI